MRGGGSKAIWDFSENSSDLVAWPVPNSVLKIVRYLIYYLKQSTSLKICIDTGIKHQDESSLNCFFMTVLNQIFLPCAVHRRQWCQFSEDCSLREIGAPWAPGLGARGEFQFALRDQAGNDVVHWIYWKLLRIRSPVKMWPVCVNAVAAKWMTGPPEWTDLGYSPTQLDAFNGRDEVTGGKRNLHLTVWPVGRMGACRMFHLRNRTKVAPHWSCTESHLFGNA